MAYFGDYSYQPYPVEGSRLSPRHSYIGGLSYRHSYQPGMDSYHGTMPAMGSHMRDSYVPHSNIMPWDRWSSGFMINGRPNTAIHDNLVGFPIDQGKYRLWGHAHDIRYAPASRHYDYTQPMFGPGGRRPRREHPTGRRHNYYNDIY